MILDLNLVTKYKATKQVWQPLRMVTTERVYGSALNVMVSLKLKNNY